MFSRTLRIFLQILCCCAARLDPLGLSAAFAAPSGSLSAQGDAAKEELVATVFTGQVIEPGGRPADGAIVVSSAGGKCIAAADGSFQLEVELPFAADSVQITAVQGSSATARLASALVPIAHSGGKNPAGVLALQQNALCQPAWLPTFGHWEELSNSVFALTVFDDGSGPALYAGGSFTTVGGRSVNRIAKWDGTSWSPLGSGMNAEVRALTVHDDGHGGGPALYAAGNFTTAGGVAANYIARWNGTNWSALGSGAQYGSLETYVLALAVFDDGSGSGPALYAGGNFFYAGGALVSHIAKWNGTNWSRLSTGMRGGFGYGRVLTLAVYDDGGGEALYAGGEFGSAGGVPAGNIAKWDGTNWSPLGSGMNRQVSALTVYDDGGGEGPALYAGGWFQSAGGVPAPRIARWNGLSWSALGNSPSGFVGLPIAMTVFDDGAGAGPALYVGGSLGLAGGMPVHHIARWDGTSWSSVDSGVNSLVKALAVFDDGQGGGPALYAGGDFGMAGNVRTSHVAKWDGTSWSPPGNGLNGSVHALTVFDDGHGGGPGLYVGGELDFAGDAAVHHIGKWEGTSWSSLGGGMNGNVLTLIVHDDGAGGGLALYAGGGFTNAGGVPAGRIAKWDGTSWAPLGAGTNGHVVALAVYEDGSGGAPALYAGGDFTIAGGGMVNHIAKWDGTNWSPLGNGVMGGFPASRVLALAVHDDGSSGAPALYAGGEFTAAGGVQADAIAKWDGTSWSPLGSGMNAAVRALTVHDDGSGPALYAGGEFTIAGGVAANAIARWDGTAWSPLGGGMNAFVSALKVYDDGTGPALYAGGNFSTADGVAASSIAKWDGASWSPLGSGVFGGVFALAVYDDNRGVGPSLYAGGLFTSAIDSGDSFLAKWGGCSNEQPFNYCSGKTTSAGCVPFMSFSGTPSASGGPFDVFSNNHIEGQSAIYLYSVKKANLDFHGGKLCVKAPLHRLSTLIQATDGLACTGCTGSCRMFKRDFNRFIQAGTDPLLTPGQSVHVQVRQHDPANLGPTAFADNLSDALALTIGP